MKRGLSIVLASIMTVCLFAAPASASNGAAGLGLSVGATAFTTFYMRVDTSSYVQAEGLIGFDPYFNNDSCLRGEMNMLLLFNPGGRFIPYARFGVGLNYLTGDLTPDLHIGGGFTLMLAKHVQLNADASMGYTLGAGVTGTINVGLGIRFFD